MSDLKLLNIKECEVSPSAVSPSALDARLELEDGAVFEGKSFGFPTSVAGEAVFNTGMVGYPEAMTDPSYRGQILTLTYPLVGNYGVPPRRLLNGLDTAFESDRIQISGLVVSEASAAHSHWESKLSLAQWLQNEGVAAICDVDTRALTKHLRTRGTLLGRIVAGDAPIDFYDPNTDDLVAAVSVRCPTVYGSGKRKIVLVDGGCKNSIIRHLLQRDVTVVRVPFDYDFLVEPADAIVISNGPGDPKMCTRTIENVRRAMERKIPTFGVCLGNQILALAAGADTYKLKYGHRGQNQPCIELATGRCFITSQNHGYAVDLKTLPTDWEPSFINANDGTVEGVRHRYLPFGGVQFHPEGHPGPLDTNFFFDAIV
jgi:carbamoyl-phosphate synthase small subunit